jgi:hypothetical protein
LFLSTQRDRSIIVLLLGCLSWTVQAKTCLDFANVAEGELELVLPTLVAKFEVVRKRVLFIVIQVHFVLNVLLTEERPRATTAALEAVFALPAAGRNVHNWRLEALEMLGFLAAVADHKEFPVSAAVAVSAENAVVAEPVPLELLQVVWRGRRQTVGMERLAAKVAPQKVLAVRKGPAQVAHFLEEQTFLVKRNPNGT